MIGYLGGCTNFFLWYNIRIPPYLNIIVSTFVCSVAYAIVRHQLLGIEIIIKKTLIFTGLLASVFAILILPTLLIQEYITRAASFGVRVMGLAISGIIIILTMRRIETFLISITDTYLFQKKYDYKELLKTFTSEVLTVLDLDKLMDLTVTKLKEIMRLQSCRIEILDQGATVTAPSKDEFAIPITMQHEMVGTLYLGKKLSDRDYNQDDLDILHPLAKTLAIAISNAKLFVELGKTQAEAAQNEKMATIGTLAAGMAHEIRNPITTIRTFADYLPEQYANKDFMDNFNKLVPKEIDRVENIARSLLEFSYTDDRGIERFDMKDVLRNVMSVLQPQYKFTGLRILLNVKEPVFINNNRVQLQEAVFNIMKYIIGEASKDAAISLDIEAKDNRPILSIAVDKLNMPEPVIKDIFEPASKFQRTKRGFGFGLLMAKQLIEKTGGKFSISARGDNGTEFRIDLNDLHNSKNSVY